MNFDLGQEHELVRSTVREFAEQRVAPVAAELDRESRFPYDLVAELGELGLMGMTIPEDYGGAGTDTLSYAIAVEELTRIDSSVAITVAAHHSLGTLPIYYFGNEEQKRQWLPDLASGKRLAAFGLTAPSLVWLQLSLEAMSWPPLNTLTIGSARVPGTLNLVWPTAMRGALRPIMSDIGRKQLP